jgi:hypothetical protein
LEKASNFGVFRFLIPKIEIFPVFRPTIDGHPIHAYQIIISTFPKKLLFDKFLPLSHSIQNIQPGTLKVTQTIFLITRSMNEDKRNE